mgnify:CR=1 FL=1
MALRTASAVSDSGVGEAGGTDTFQRLPETGYTLPNTSLFASPLLFGMEGDFVNFYREQGFTLNRDLISDLLKSQSFEGFSGRQTKKVLERVLGVLVAPGEEGVHHRPGSLPPQRLPLRRRRAPGLDGPRAAHGLPGAGAALSARRAYHAGVKRALALCLLLVAGCSSIETAGTRNDAVLGTTVPASPGHSQRTPAK